MDVHDLPSGALPCKVMWVCPPLHRKFKHSTSGWFANSVVGFFHGAPSMQTSRVAQNPEDDKVFMEGSCHINDDVGCSICQYFLAAACALASLQVSSARALPMLTLTR